MQPSILVYCSEDSIEVVAEVLPLDDSGAFRTTLIVTGLTGTNAWFRKKLGERLDQFQESIRPLILRRYPTLETAKKASSMVESALGLFTRFEMSEFDGIISAVETVEMEHALPSH